MFVEFLLAERLGVFHVVAFRFDGDLVREPVFRAAGIVPAGLAVVARDGSELAVGVEVDLGSETTATLRAKFAAWAAVIESAAPGVPGRLLFVAADVRRVGSIRPLVASTGADTMCDVTTFDELATLLSSRWPRGSAAPNGGGTVCNMPTSFRSPTRQVRRFGRDCPTRLRRVCCAIRPGGAFGLTRRGSPKGAVQVARALAQAVDVPRCVLNLASPGHRRVFCMSNTAYDILGLPMEATSADIKARYKQLVVELHPDRHGCSAAATARFKEINQAYAILSDPVRRQKLDGEIHTAQLIAAKARESAAARSSSGTDGNSRRDASDVAKPSTPTSFTELAMNLTRDSSPGTMLGWSIAGFVADILLVTAAARPMPPSGPMAR